MNSSTNRFARELAEQTYPPRPVSTVIKAYKHLKAQPKSDFWLRFRGLLLKHNIKKVGK